jgi:hypothetical protein
MARDAFYSGRHVVARKSFVAGTGVALERTASMNYGEIKGAWRQKRYGDALPGLMVYAGLIGAVFFAALSVLVLTRWKVFGGILLAFTVVGAAQTLRWFIAAEPAAPPDEAGGPEAQ